MFCGGVGICRGFAADLCSFGLVLSRFRYRFVELCLGICRGLAMNYYSFGKEFFEDGKHVWKSNA